MVMRQPGTRSWVALLGVGALLFTIALWASAASAGWDGRADRTLCTIDLADGNGSAMAAVEDGDDGDHRVAVAVTAPVVPAASRYPGPVAAAVASPATLDGECRLRLAPKTSPPRAG